MLSEGSVFCCVGAGEERAELDVPWDWDLQGHAVEQGGRGRELPADGLGALSKAGSGSEARETKGSRSLGGRWI